MPKLVNTNQTCLPNRNIEDNIHTIQNLIDHINNTDGELAIIFLDQEKAFDRMSHTFLLKTLEKFDFGENFVNWVKILMKNTKSFVKVNGFETFEFDIERGVRQGCPLSGLLYVLAAEVLAENIRKNAQIKGIKYGMKNLQPLEHKISQYADDTSVSVTSVNSIDALFKTLKEYEMATNAKINKDKTEGLWVGRWKNRLDKPHNLIWKNSNVKFLGIYVGNKVGANGTKALSDLNFAEQLEKVKNKMNYWRGKGVSLIGRVKVVNIFILSRFWHRTKIISINSELLKTYEKLIRDFIWQNKQGGRVRQDVLQLSFENGGLQLTDIKIKIQTQRIQRILYLLQQESSSFERFLADQLIGNSTKFKHRGLSFGLSTNIERIKIIKNHYYREALTFFNELGIKLIPGQRKLIHNEPVFASNFFLDINGVPFTPNVNDNCPKTIYELTKSTKTSPIIRAMHFSLNNIIFSNQNKNDFVIDTENGTINMNNATFKTIYSELIVRKNTCKEWENKWANYLEIDETTHLNWSDIWKMIHNSLNNPYIISAQWEILHLNFWSSFKANENCNVCHELALNNVHIATECKVLIDTLNVFKIQNFFTTRQLLSFGCNNELVNFVYYHIRKIIFRSRFKNFQNYQDAKNQILKECKKGIKLDLENKLFWATKMNKRTNFENTFLRQSDFELCRIAEHNKIVLI